MELCQAGCPAPSVVQKDRRDYIRIRCEKPIIGNWFKCGEVLKTYTNLQVLRAIARFPLGESA